MEQNIEQRLIEQEARLRQLDERCEGLELVIAWLLHRQPDQAGDIYLRMQANALDQPEHRQRYLEIIALLDHLHALASLLPGSPATPQAG